MEDDKPVEPQSSAHYLDRYFADPDVVFPPGVKWDNVRPVFPSAAYFSDTHTADWRRALHDEYDV